MAGDDAKLFMTRSLNVAPKTTEQHLIACIGTFEFKVTDSRRVRSRYCTIDTNY